MPTSFEAALGADAPNTPATGFTVAIGGWAHGSISTAGDADFIAVDLVAGQSYSFAMVGIGATALQDGRLRLYASDGTVLLGEDDNSLPNGHALLRFTAVETERAYLQASAVGSLAGGYAVSASVGPKAQFDAAMITGILDSHASWSPARGAGVTLSYGFSDTVSHGQPGFSQFTPAQMELTRSLLAMFGEVAGLTFVEVNTGGYTDAATLLYGNFSASDGAVSWAGGPGDTGFASSAGDVWINTNGYTPPSETPLPGSFDALMMMQLIGESLGLSRPGLYAGVGPITYATHADFAQDSAQFTVMSRFGAEETGASALRPDTLGIHDVHALQQIYGANLTTRAGADTYGFGTTAGPVYDFDLNLDPMLTIWDAGGIDTLDLSRYSAAQTVSLIAGSQSSIGGFLGNLSIAFGTVIEHAFGGRGGDAITGNAAANLLRGNRGRDTLSGDQGHDTLEGGAGSDTLYGGAGNDVLRGDSVTGAPPPPSFALVSTNPTTGAALQAAAIDLFLQPSFTLDLIWRQDSSDDPGPVARFGNLVLHRHADGLGSLEFEGAAVDGFLNSILPAPLFDGDLHRLTLSYEDIGGHLTVWLDGVRVAERQLVPGTRNLLNQGDVTLSDHASVGDIRLFDQVRSAQEIWDMAWSPLPDPATTSGLLANWRGDGSGALVNHLPSLPALAAVGSVGIATGRFEAVNGGNLMVGGVGDDTYLVLNPLDVVLESPGDGLDRIIASVNYALGAGQSVEVITVAAGSGGVALTGNALANRMVSSTTHADTLTGGAGNDTFAVHHSGDRVIEAAGGGTDRIDAYANHTLFANSSVEFIYAMGSAGRFLTGNALANRFISNAAYADTLIGGAGNDTYAVHHAGDRVIEATAGGTDRIDAYANHTLRAGSSVELIYAMGSTGRSLTGNSLANQFFSNAARADTLTGGSGNDIYHLRHTGDRVIERAGGGTDVIYSSVHYTLAAAEAVEEVRAATGVGLRLTGNGFSQNLHGGTGRDTLEGGGGQDRLFGGADTQVDRFVFRSLTDSAVGAGRDRIYQFRSGIDDVDLRAIDANITRAGDQAFAYSATGPMAFALWLTNTSSGVLVRMDATGDARPDSEILISGLTRAAQGDFLL